MDLQKVEVNEENISEVLRLYVVARNEGATHHLSDLLKDKPLVSLSPNNKAAVLAYLCNELLCGKSIGREIEGNLDNMANLRRDKWTLEGEIRKLKADMSKTNTSSSTTPKGKEKEKDNGESQEEDDEQSNDEDGNNTFNNESNDADDTKDTSTDKVHLEYFP